MQSADENSPLAAALVRHNIQLPADQIESLDRYRETLWEWNQKLNLTRHTDFDKFVGRDIVDSLAFEPFLEPGQRVLDVGTGGGVPGIVLAVVRPDLKLTLCESVAKRARAVEAIVRQLNLVAEVVHARAEDLLLSQSFDTLVARAVAPLPKLLGWLDERWNAFDQLLLVTGPAWVEQRQEARELGLLGTLELRRLNTYQVPVSGAESFVLRVRPREHAES